MIGIITLMATLVISLLVTRVGAVALKLTGMSEEAAKFQARSAYTGVGFTTSESEQIVNHPVRRRVVQVLMLCGNVGIAVVIASMMATFAAGEAGPKGVARALILSIGLLALWIAGTQKWVDDSIGTAIEWALKKWTHLDVRDYVSLLHLADGYVVLELTVAEGDWVAQKSLAEAKLSHEGVLILGIHRANGKYVGSPDGKIVVQVGDVLSVYGKIQRLEELDLRKEGYEGDLAHEKAMEKQQVAAQIQVIEQEIPKE